MKEQGSPSDVEYLEGKMKALEAAFQSIEPVLNYEVEKGHPACFVADLYVYADFLADFFKEMYELLPEEDQTRVQGRIMQVKMEGFFRGLSGANVQVVRLEDLFRAPEQEGTTDGD